MRAARPIPPRRRDATKFVPIQSAFPRQSDPQLRTPFRTPIVSPHRTRLLCTQALPVVGALSPWLLPQPLPALRAVSTPRARGWRALSAITSTGEIPVHLAPALVFAKVRMGMRASLDRRRLSTSANETRRTSTLRAPDSRPPRKPVAPLAGPMSFSGVCAVFVSPFRNRRAMRSEPRKPGEKANTLPPPASWPSDLRGPTDPEQRTRAMRGRPFS